MLKHQNLNEKKFLIAFSLLFAFSFAFVVLNTLNIKLGFAGGCSGCPSCLCDCNIANPWTVGICKIGEICDGTGCVKCGDPGYEFGDHTGTCNNVISCLTPPTGGLVPCGRMFNNIATPWDDTADCQLCHFVILADSIIDFLMKMVAIVAVLALVVGGLIYMKTAGNTSSILSAKQNFNKILYGFTIIFIAWVAVNIAMVLFGFSDPLGNGNWAVFNCDVP